MKVKWLGHAAFLITAEDGTRIVTDPFGDYPGLRYSPVREAADIVTVSHDHGDHCGGPVKGSFREVKGSGRARVGKIEFKGIETFHDTSGGSERGPNTVFCFTVDGVRICHLGDLGHDLSDAEVSEIGQVDVLMIPVGGCYTIDSETAGAICERLGPKVTMPMHYKTGKCDFPISGVDEFVRGKPRVRRLDRSEVEFRAGQLPDQPEIVVLRHAL